MEFIVLEILINTATFRNPEFQNFHKTLSLPPPTTIMGMAGAAMGMPPKATQDFFDQSNFKFGVYGMSDGKAKDTWKFPNLKKNSLNGFYNYHPNIAISNVINKEILFNNKFFIAFGSDNTDTVNQLVSAFQNPKFALTLGNSDSLAKIKKIETIQGLSKSNRVRNCIVEGNIIDKVLSNPNKNLEFSIYQTAEPIAYDLPVRFEYESDYGKRIVSNIKPFSFITAEMILNFELQGIEYNNIFIPICDL